MLAPTNYYIFLAKSAVESYVLKQEIIAPPRETPNELLKKQAGVFVTIKKQEELRGCIGTYLPTKGNLAEEIIQNAIAAAAEDYRFDPISGEELPYLSYTVCLLSAPELVEDISSLDPKKYGIIIKTAPDSGTGDAFFKGKSPQKSGLLLPDLEGVDTIERQISIACQKGAIDPEKEKILIYRFTVEKYQ